MHPAIVALVRGISRAHTTLYRLLGGRGVLGRNTLLLTTRGRKTGRETTIPLFHVAEGDRLYVVASMGGNDNAPGWYANLTANPDVRVELNGETKPYRARTVTDDEKARVWPKLTAMYKPYDAYQERTTRKIPVIELTPA